MFCPFFTLLKEVKYVTAKRIFEQVVRCFEQFGFPCIINKNVVPENDDTTLFNCSGMQPLKQRFQNPDKSHYGSLQSCIRTNDLSLVGDGTHLIYFEMLGNFSFGGNDYEQSVELWHCLLKDLEIKVDYITVHPSQIDHLKMWQSRGYQIHLDNDCEWSDGKVGGYCCEVFSNGTEIGNLVNPMGHSVMWGLVGKELL